MPFLRQSTSHTIRFGPCLDKTNGVDEETALTLAQADMRLSKDGGAFAQKSAAGNATHDSDGWYFTTFSTTDTNTVGELKLNVHQPANMLPVWEKWWVLEEAVYDAIFGAGANLVNASGHVQRVVLVDTTTANSDMRGTDNAALVSVLGALADAAANGDPTATDTIMAYVKQLINILVGTVGIPTYPAAVDPANNVNLAEVLRAIRDDVTGIGGAAMRGTDGVDTSTMRGTDGALIDKAGFSLSAAGVLAIWHQLLSGIVTADTIGKLIKDEMTPVRMQILTDWINAGRLDLLLDAIKAVTDKFVFTVAGLVNANLKAVADNTDTPTILDRAERTTTRFTVGVGSTTTNIITSSMDPAAVAIDQFKDLVMKFDKDTTTANLRGQGQSITSNTAAGVLTVPALTTPPVSGDTGTIS